jgi:hypothetical protein
MKRITRGWLSAFLVLTGFCGLAAEPLVLEVRVSYRWAGLSVEWPGYDYVFACTSSTNCTVRGTTWTDVRSEDKRRITCRLDRQPLNASSALQRLWQASKLNLKPITKPLEIIDHTDDYPQFDASILTSSGTSQLQNNSNAFKGRRPWNVKRDGRWYTQNSDEIQQAFDALIKLLPCETKR